MPYTDNINRDKSSNNDNNGNIANDTVRIFRLLEIAILFSYSDAIMRSDVLPNVFWDYCRDEKITTLYI